MKTIFIIIGLLLCTGCSGRKFIIVNKKEVYFPLCTQNTTDNLTKLLIKDMVKSKRGGCHIPDSINIYYCYTIRPHIEDNQRNIFRFDLKSLHGTITSTLVSAVISTSNESALIQSLNNISEEGYHLLTGTVSSFASGMANSYAYGNTDLIWQSIAKGAISSISNSIVNGSLSKFSKKLNDIERTRFGNLSEYIDKWYNDFNNDDTKNNTSDGNIEKQNQISGKPIDTHRLLQQQLHLGVPQLNQMRETMNADSYPTDFRFIY